MIDTKGETAGTWTQNGNEVTVNFNGCVYQGRINGQTLSVRDGSPPVVRMAKRGRSRLPCKELAIAWKFKQALPNNELGKCLSWEMQLG